MKIKVQFSTDAMGGIIGAPVSDKIREQYAEHMRQFRPGDDGTVYFQDHEAEYLYCMIPRRKARELEQGYSVVCLIDPWDFGNMLGYDACHVEIKR